MTKKKGVSIRERWSRFFPIERSTLFASSKSSSSAENDADADTNNENNSSTNADDDKKDTNNDTNDTDDVEGKKTSSSCRDACDAFFSRRAIR